MSQRELERQLTRIYRQARDDIGRKWYEYFEKGEKRLAAQEKELEFLKAHGTKDEIEQAERELEAAKQNFTLKNEYYRDMVKETTRQMADVNQTAAAYVNGQLPSFYAETFNGEMAIESVEMGIKFDMADEATVKRRVMDGDIQLPAKKVNVPKDMRWNTKAINSNVLQGIIQGESMDKIAKRLEPIMDGNRKAAIRNARTLVNGAENQGRQDKYNELGKRGVVLQKQWIATGDERTRDWHLDMDGQRVDTDEKFVDGNGNELEYPGDPSAPPETVYNCRCTMKGIVKGFVSQETGEFIEVKGEPDRSRVHEDDIRKEYERRAIEQADKEEKEREKQESEDLRKDGRDKPDYLKRLEKSGIGYNQPEEYKVIPSEQEIIDKISGGDMTKGSCATQCLVYAGNKAGYDVEDFRGGESQSEFSLRKNNIERYKELGANIVVEEGKNDFTIAHKLMKQMEPDKEYILMTGHHAAIVRKTESGFEYLETQSSRSNGWKKFNGDDTLKYRFACQKSHSFYGQSYSVSNATVEVDSIKKSKDLQETLGYVNTKQTQQWRGESGHEK